MEKTKAYKSTRFSADVLREAVKAFEGIAATSHADLDSPDLSVSKEAEDWRYDNEEEFFASYRQGFWYATYDRRTSAGSCKFRFMTIERKAEISVKAPTRAQRGSAEVRVVGAPLRLLVRPSRFVFECY